MICIGSLLWEFDRFCYVYLGISRSLCHTTKYRTSAHLNWELFKPLHYWHLVDINHSWPLVDNKHNRHLGHNWDTRRGVKYFLFFTVFLQVKHFVSDSFTNILLQLGGIHKQYPKYETMFVRGNVHVPSKDGIHPVRFTVGNSDKVNIPIFDAL